MQDTVGATVANTPRVEVPDFVEGPFYRWYEGLSSKNVKEAHDVIFEIIEEEGPFDGVLGFSQGASLVLSILMHHEINHPEKPPPFRFAILLCAVVVVSPDPNFNAKAILKYRKYYNEPDLKTLAGDNPNGAQLVDGDDEIEEAEEEKENQAPASGKGKKSLFKPKSAPKHRGMLLLRSQREALAKEMVDLIRELTALDPVHKYHNDGWKTGTMDDFPRIFHPLAVKERVTIPTVHVYGKEDPIANQSALVVRLCDKKKSKTIVYEGGHYGPTSLSDLRAIAAAIEWAMQKSMYA